MSNLRPIGNLVAIKPKEEQQRVTESGIVLPQTYKDPSIIGEVMGYGPGLLTEDGSYIREDIKVGDVVVFKRYTAYETKDDGEVLCLVPDTDILAILDTDTLDIRGKR